MRLITFLVAHGKEKKFGPSWKRSFLASLFKTLQKSLASPSLFADGMFFCFTGVSDVTISERRMKITYVILKKCLGFLILKYLYFFF